LRILASANQPSPFKWTFKQRDPDEKWFVAVTRQDRDWADSIVNDKEAYALVVTVADRDNERANLYVEIEARIQQQVQVRERERQEERLRAAF
jgi:hypothetical protein